MKKVKCIKLPTQNSLTGYRTEGCRCDECKAANRIAVQKWRWRTGFTKRKLVDLEPGDGEV